MAATDGISLLGNIPGSLNTNEARATRATAVIPKAIASLKTKGTPILNRAGDQANVSTAGELAASVTGASDVRLAKVAHLQAAIASGNYKVAPSDVAEKLIESLLSQR